MLQAKKYIESLVPVHLAYYLHLDRPGVIDAARYRFRDRAIIYGIRCRATDQLYIGSSVNSVNRFHNHLVTGYGSNSNLQSAINKHGLGYFTLYIFEVVKFTDPDMTYAQKMKQLHNVEQQYIDMFPKHRMYNSVNSVVL